MAALIGIFGDGAASADKVLRDMQSAAGARALPVAERFSAPGAVIVVQKAAWEDEVPGWSGPRIVAASDWVVAADASLYYVDELRRQLARHVTIHPAATSGELLLAAIRLYGTRVSEVVEGDFAILAWHRPSGRVLLTREFGGRRTIAWGRATDGSTIVATSPQAVAAHPGIASDWDVVAATGAAGGMDSNAYRTAWRDVRAVAPATTEIIEAGRLVVSETWEPPEFSDRWEPEVSRHASEELLELLQRATVERLGTGPTAMWMSGGWDSTSIYAAARSAGVGADRLAITSLDYPKGDSGDERHFVEAVAHQWSAGVDWLEADAHGLFEQAADRALSRDDPWPHPFESVVRGLARRASALGCRVAFDGAGGDHLFLVSTGAVFGQHLASGRLGELWRAWRGYSIRPRQFARLCLLPNLDTGTLGWIGQVRGRALGGFWDMPAAPWIRRGPAFEALRNEHPLRRTGEGPAAYEARSLLTSARLGRVVSQVRSFCLGYEVELRSPFLDRRLLRFAAARPQSDRGDSANSKRILRQAVDALLPAEVLKGRKFKTGTPVDYFRRQMERDLPTEIDAITQPPVLALADLGVIDPDILRSGAAAYQRRANHLLGSALHVTIETERWFALRDRER